MSAEEKAVVKRWRTWMGWDDVLEIDVFNPFEVVLDCLNLCTKRSA